MGGRENRVDGATPSPAMVRRMLEESYRGPAWHGPSVLVALRGVTARQAGWRPADGRNSIWALTLHLAYGRHRMLGRLARMDGGRVPRFPRARDPEWFPLLPETRDEEAWRADLALLEECHARLLDALARTSPDALGRMRHGKDRTIGLELLGLALHDAYHAGQIRLLAKLAS